MIIHMAAGAEPEIEHLINRRSRNHRSAKIASKHLGGRHLRLAESWATTRRQGNDGRGVGDKVLLGEE